MRASQPKLSFEELIDSNEGISERAGLSYLIYVKQTTMIFLFFKNNISII
jgi:hypothetical protein